MTHEKIAVRKSNHHASKHQTLGVLALLLSVGASACSTDGNSAAPGADASTALSPAKTYANQPPFTPPNTRVDNYLDVLPGSFGPAVDRAKGYYTAEIRGG